jgi:hypothetical protein
MDAILSAASKPPLLRAGVQPAIAAGDDHRHAATELELISILESPSFRGSPRSAAFLRFVVEETLAGRQGLLKERTIGAAVLGKSPDYDTGSDSGVRVRANEVRKRLAGHYERMQSRAGIRIELPAGTYVPRFISPVAPTPAALPESVNALPQDPPPMQLWQMAAPSIVAVFLALIAIRGNVESSDSFSRFWNHALAGRTAISIVVDADGPSAISPAMADAAMPLEALAAAFQAQVHILAEERASAVDACVIRMSTKRRPDGPALLSLSGAAVFGARDGAALWVWAENPDKLRLAAQTLASRSGFPEIP